MRHYSQRVPGKNYRPLAGRPLYHHIIMKLLSCAEIAEVVVDTDSTTIMEGLHRDFPQVTILERPQHLRDGEIPMNEVLLHDTSQVEGEFYLQTHSTNPLLRAETISRAIQVFLANYPAYDSLFSVTRVQIRLWDALNRPINHNPAILLRTQDLPPVFEENSCIYLFTRQTLVERCNRLGARPFMFEIEAMEAWDIDDEIDFQIADYLMQKETGDKG
jgi:CMP-N-acetylneuraminic acid synthetase